MKIAILYIGTGRYTIFWKKFYQSCEKFFLKNADKQYFFFTDSNEFKSNKNVTVIPQKNLNWPMIACMRYKILNSLKETLKDYDYAFFFNANMEFLREIKEEEFLPSAKDGGIVAALHSMNKREKDNLYFPYERNPKSSSCIPYGVGDKYYHSGILGGRVDSFLSLLNTCEEMMDADLAENLIPIVHDESVFNKYILDKNFLELSNYYIYPTVGKLFYRLDKRVKIIQRNKSSLKYGGHAYLRGETDKKNAIIKEQKNKISTDTNPKISLITNANDEVRELSAKENEIPDISVVMPVYNAQEDFLKAATESILNQTYKNFELVIVNDGSTNNAENVILSYKDPRIIYLKQNNKGIVGALNNGISNAKGQFIARMDSDDIAVPTRLEKQIQFLFEHSDIGVLGTWFMDFSAKKEDIVKNPVNDEQIKQNLLTIGCCLAHPSIMMRTEIFNKYSAKYNEAEIYAEDYGLWLSLIDKIKFANYPEVLLHRRWHGKNISKTHSLVQSINSQFIMVKAQSKYFNIDANNILAMFEKLKNNKKILSGDLLELENFANGVSLKMSELNMQAEYQLNRVFYKTALKKCKKDLLYLKILWTSKLNDFAQIRNWTKIENTFRLDNK